MAGLRLLLGSCSVPSQLQLAASWCCEEWSTADGGAPAEECCLPDGQLQRYANTVLNCIIIIIMQIEKPVRAESLRIFSPIETMRQILLLGTKLNRLEYLLQIELVSTEQIQN